MNVRLPLVLTLALTAGVAVPTANAGIIFNSGGTVFVPPGPPAPPYSEPVQVSNNTTVIFNAGGDIATSSVTSNVSAVAVSDTSTIINNAGNLSSNRPSGPTGGTGIIASNNSSVLIFGGTVTGSGGGPLGIGIGDNATLSIFGGSVTSTGNGGTGIEASGNAAVSIFGGTVTSSGGAEVTRGINVVQNAKVSIFGGAITASSTLEGEGIEASGNAAVSIFGGSIRGSLIDLLATGGGDIILHGDHFNFPFGPVEPTSGTITGNLQDGTAIDFSFLRAENGQVVLVPAQVVPEPSTLTLLGIGTLGLLAYTWRCR